MSEPVAPIAHYRVRDGHVDEFLSLVGRHGPTRVYLGHEKESASPLVIEIFEWADDDAAGRAHTHPEVSEVWEAMDPLCEARDGRPAMEFPHLRPVSVS